MQSKTPSRRRVLFISPQPFFEWRGSPIRVSFNVRALAELGYEVDLLTFPVGQDVSIPGVRIVRVPNIIGVKDVAIGPTPRKAVLDVLLFARAFAMAARRRYDVIHGVEEAGAMAVTVSTLLKTRAVFEKHSDPASYRQNWRVNLVVGAYASVERMTARRVGAVIATGPGLAEQIRERTGMRGIHTIFDIPSSLVESRPEDAARVRGTLDPAGDAVLATYVGSFAVYQGVDLLFASIPRVLKRAPRTRFVIIGGTPENIGERKRELEAQGAAGAVQFLGRVPPDALPDYLGASDILLSPRLSGVNTPLKLLDYAKAGRAVLAADTPANRLILDDRTSLRAAPEPEAFADGICRLAADADLRERLGRAARRLVDETYNFNNFRRLLGEVYDGLLRPRESGIDSAREARV